MAITKGIRELVREATGRINTVSLEDARMRLEDEATQFVDLRDVRELWREGPYLGSTPAARDD